MVLGNLKIEDLETAKKLIYELDGLLLDIVCDTKLPFGMARDISLKKQAIFGKIRNDCKAI